MQVKFINRSHHPLPKYETTLSAGMDLRAFLPEGPITLKPLERGLVKTGLFMELPAGYEAQVRPRSGLALKKGITVLNSPGTIDADYRGEVCVILINLSGEEFVINDGALSVMDLNEVDTDLWRRGITLFGAKTLEAEMRSMAQILLKAA